MKTLTDPVNEQQEETNDNKRTVKIRGQVVKPVVRTTLMQFNPPTIKDNYYV
jgi:hypothetical protein